MTHITALSPLDGRYGKALAALRPIASEYGLLFYRVVVELQWFIVLTEHPDIVECKSLSEDETSFIRKLISEFDETSAAHIKSIEKETNHDVKAVEYYLKQQFSKIPRLKERAEFLHFACTSEDINNLAYGLMVKDARDKVLLPALDTLLSHLKSIATQTAALPMLSRTHGQAATPTTLGKEFANVLKRLQMQIQTLTALPIFGKLNGAVGNYNAHLAAYPTIDWLQVSEQFVTQLGLTWNPYTTQIEPHDGLAEFSHTLARINTILIDFAQDVWHYISLGYFKQHQKSTEVGSSTMPHKVNPIDFENAEGNLGLANALLLHFASKLPISRWQRDLSDSTVLRNIGVAFGHALLAYQSLDKGLQKLDVDQSAVETDLESHWEVLAEAVQTVMRRYHVPEPYETLKAFTRGKQLDETTLRDFIRGLTLPESVKNELLRMTPRTFIGEAQRLARNATLSE